MNILVTGASGQLGSELRELVKNTESEFTDKIIKNSKFFFTNKDKLDITKKEDIEKFVNENSIDFIINCAAYTAVDKAEEEKELADLVNHKAVEYLANVCRQKGIYLIHISTDYVFDGKNYRPYVETDKVAPQGVYGETKLKGEEAFKKAGAKGIIIRTSWVYSSYGHNFVKTMLRLAQTKDELGVIFDQVGTPTYAKDLASALLKIVSLEASNEKSLQDSVNIYHYSNEGVCSWYDFAKAIFEISGNNIKINAIETKEYPTPAKRPHYSVLNKLKIKNDFNIHIPYWKDSLRECITKILND
ncbi:dTDP-4-dehydrorhamnose reductase [Hydrogenimonas thermophila]|uniref:dTDP-4-dehydrorhamnose reductase n=1 Tax=Hydrogenimonas thermophila TaxID=223786 RepID=UPI0029374A44|nr:dTDP-4-dehydrorhamnose reductase [Hydrogenimonas thermophila]WOE69451.1 dTDP-4-dehydrorhamnose reductase [Hydrogenimonas thermophila]WOE71962.1 dTDP-4-dehydrorhamnose reductase [Hydrogenimonas thermophila]